MPSWNSWVKLLVGIGLVALGIVVAMDSERAERWRIVQAFLEKRPTAAPILYILFYIVGSTLLLPGTALSLAGALLFGYVWGTFYTWIGATIGAFCALHVGRWIGRDFVERLFAGRFAAFDRLIEERGFQALLLIRLLPIFPFFGVNFGSGLTRIRIRDYMLATAIGIVPGTFVYQYLFATLGERVLHEGFHWSDLASPEVLAPIGLFVAFLLVGRWLAGYFFPTRPSVTSIPSSCSPLSGSEEAPSSIDEFGEQPKSG